MTVSEEKAKRAYRLLGDGKRGGGLPLPPLFQAVMDELYDRGSCTVDDLVGAVEKAVWKPARVNVLYPNNGYIGLATDALEQLKTRKKAVERDGLWEPRFALNKEQIVFPPKRGDNGKIIEKTGLKVTVYTPDERVRRRNSGRDHRELRTMYNDLLNERTFSVRADSGRGRLTRMALRLHPLARSIPQMSEQEFMDLGYDIKEHGVKVPIVLFDGEVLDGRHRVAVAAALQVPIGIEKFDGDEAAARDMVVSLNLQRRNLNIPQRALIVQQLFLPQAEAETNEREREAGVFGAEITNSGVAPVGGNLTLAVSVKATQAAAARSHGLASARTLQRMQPVREAPKTQERIRRGEITSATQARREALAELGLEAPADIQAMMPRSPYMSMGQALYELRKANLVLSGDNPWKTSNEQFLSRLLILNEALEETARLINGLLTD